jgi:hypothetical protein
MSVMRSNYVAIRVAEGDTDEKGRGIDPGCNGESQE